MFLVPQRFNRKVVFVPVKASKFITEGKADVLVNPVLPISFV